MKTRMGNAAAVVLLACGMAVCAEGAALKPKALVIMLDGTRADAIENACAPNIRMLRDGKWQSGYKCMWSLSASTILDAPTLSGPNHVSIATGVTAAKTTVQDNRQMARCDYSKWQTWLSRLAAARPGLKALFAYSWRPDEKIGPGPSVEFVHGTDVANAVEIPRRLGAADGPDATMWYIDCPDHGGHYHGFYPYSPGYFRQVLLADKAVGDALRAIASRPTFAEEDWMVVVTADHGGYKHTHGPMSGQCWTIPLLVAGRAVPQGRLEGVPRDYDIAPTVLAHFGMDLSAMDLDGAPIAPRIAAERKRALKDGLVAYLDFESGVATNLVAGGPRAEASAAAIIHPRGGVLGKGLRMQPGTNGTSFVRLAGSERLKFENGADFTMALWVRLDGTQPLDSPVAGNCDVGGGCRAGLALLGARMVPTLKEQGVSLAGGLADGVFELGQCAVESLSWNFFVATRGRDGVLALYQGGTDGYLYRIAVDAKSLNLDSGLPFCLGQDGTGRCTKIIKGNIDEFALWTRALSDDEVRRIYEAGRQGVALGELP